MNQYEKYHGFNPGLRHRQAGRAVRHPGPRRGHRPRRRASWRSSCSAGWAASRSKRASRCRASATSARTRPSSCSEAEFKIVAVSDVSGGYYRPEGLDIPDVLHYACEHQRLAARLHRGRADHQRAAAGARRRAADPRGAGRRDHGRERRAHQGADHHRGGQRTRSGPTPTRSSTSAARSCCPTSWPTPAA